MPLGRPRIVHGQKRWAHWGVRGCGYVFSLDAQVYLDYVWHAGLSSYTGGTTPRALPAEDAYGNSAC